MEGALYSRGGGGVSGSRGTIKDEPCMRIDTLHFSSYDFNS